MIEARLIAMAFVGGRTRTTAIPLIVIIIILVITARTEGREVGLTQG